MAEGAKKSNSGLIHAYLAFTSPSNLNQDICFALFACMHLLIYA